jgi:hypothetical protein
MSWHRTLERRTIDRLSLALPDGGPRNRPLTRRERLGLLATMGVALALMAYLFAVTRLQLVTGEGDFSFAFWGSFSACYGQPIGSLGHCHTDLLFGFLVIPLPTAVFSLLLPFNLSSTDMLVYFKALFAGIVLAASVPMYLTAVLWGLRALPAFLLVTAFLLNPVLLLNLDQSPGNVGMLALGLLALMHARRNWTGCAGAAAMLCLAHPAGFLLAGSFAVLLMPTEGEGRRWRNRILLGIVAFVAYLGAASTLTTHLGLGKYMVQQSTITLRSIVAAFLSGSIPLQLLSHWGRFLAGFGMSIASLAFLPLLAGRGLLLMVLPLLYGLFRDAGVLRSSFATDLGAFFLLSVIGIRWAQDRFAPRRFALAAASLALVVAVLGEVAPLPPWINGRPTLFQRYGIPFVTHPSNPVLDEVRARVTGSPVPLRVMAELDLVPQFVGDGRVIGVFGVDALDESYDLVVLRDADQPHATVPIDRLDAAATCVRPDGSPDRCPSVPADYAASLSRLQADPAWTLVLRERGIAVWKPREPF